VSVSSSGAQGTGQSGGPAMSADGRFVAFNSFASNLVAGDANGTTDVFVHDRVAGTTTLVSVASDGTQADLPASQASISADGRIVVFETYASNLVAGDTNDQTDVFVHDRATGETTQASVSVDGAGGDDRSFSSTISGDGHHVAFSSIAANLVTGDPNANGEYDAFVRDLG
jgi:Tol biopolymer transport system component